ncbi:unnamed protein product [Diabrotica balteata]|uniref:Glycosyltransferase family 92 protein n=1 Tax=Diabrotica balteata TaxID=107213 RepID=A0A9N9SRB1_DIABA|nr:unnamed protein product [Diabrotica balteata]
MKKYHRLLLIIVSVISLILFLIYRHEYNRLHYVLEVFNFFGQPCNFSDLQTSDYTLKQYDWGPQPMWQELDNGYVYSAFLTGKIEVKAIALPLDVKKVPRNCYFWFEDKKKPLTGKFTFSKMLNTNLSSLTPYFFYCTAPTIDNTPYAVSFTYKAKRESEMKKILLVDVQITNHKIPNINTTICVSPTTFSKKKIVEFFSFHRLVGVESFIFYTKDIPYRLSKLLMNLSKRLDAHVAFLPWNFPKNDIDVAQSIIEYDCLFRTYGRSRFIITLNLNEYLVPTTSYTINELLNDLENQVHRLSLPVQKFCINNVSNNKPLALQNYDVVRDINHSDIRFIYKNVEDNNFNTNTVDKTRASVHKYVKCGIYSQTTTDYSMQKFSIDFTRSTLVQLLLHNQL